MKPTKKNIKKFFFSFIHNYSNIYFLDLFSGSGVLGFELLSLSSNKILMIEKNNFFYKNIKKNYLKFKKKNFYLIFFDSLVWILKFNFFNFSFIFIDPPYKFKNFYFYFFFIKNIYPLKKCFILFIESSKNFNLIKIPIYFFLLKKFKIGITNCYIIKLI